MEKTLSMGAFTELDEREVMETEGGGIGDILDDLRDDVNKYIVEPIQQYFEPAIQAYNRGECVDPVLNFITGTRINISNTYNKYLGSLPGYSYNWYNG